MPETSELNDWAKMVDRLPFVGSLKRDLTSLRNLLYDRRAPRIACIGRPGSGRSALANALLCAQALRVSGREQDRWVHVNADGRKLDWLELDDEPALTPNAQRSLDELAPDLVIGIVVAGEEATAGPRLRDALRAIRERLETKPKVLVALTKCDSLGGPLEPAEARPQTIDLALQSLRKTLAEVGVSDDSIVAIAAPPGMPRWNVGTFAELVLERAPEAAQLEIARAFEVSIEARRKLARVIVTSFSAIAVTVGLAPIPFADVFILMPLQIAMVSAVAYLSGRNLDARAAGEWIASLGIAGGAGMGLRWGAQQLIKLVPAAGTLIGASIAGAGTLALGRSAIAYFIEGPGRLTHRAELAADATA